ncbi:hypothetical protein CERSUDRAFT_72420 [Gelatoporia subvermispora B]|uniref:DUF6533 domain-containing protein n=1 Tax=Ceriporiopsis subvermispora (strain B) TaxID=914234 RepID=M2PRJ4_CERS8|nr:hypothetical protein CERSUDRAFT_72420 [Gelatoporia subvermispora B]
MSGLDIAYRVHAMSNELSSYISVQAVQTKRYTTLVPFAILYYDYCITFNVEIDNFWRGFTLTWVSLFFVVNRYFSLLIVVPVLVELFGYIPEAVMRALVSTARIGIHDLTAILTIRTHALYDRSRYVLGLLLTVGALVGTVGMWSMLSDRSVALDMPLSVDYWHTCDLSLTNGQTERLAIAWSGLLIFDTLVFVLTVFKTLKSNAVWRRRGLFYIIFRDGATYYGILALANIVNVITLIVPVPTAQSRALGMFITTTTTVSSVLISRLVLNLRVQGRRAAPLQSSTFNIDNGLGWDTAHVDATFREEGSEECP